MDKSAGLADAAKGEPTTTEPPYLYNAQVRVFDITYRPGDINRNPSTLARIVRALSDGTLQRTDGNGKVHAPQEWKAGQVRFVEAEPGMKYTVKNVGTTTVTLYVVRLK